jgi:hypothetical protein
MSAEDVERIDWDAIRRMVEAPAYFAALAKTSAGMPATGRGESLEVRVAKLLQSRASERLPEAEIRKLNRKRQKALQKRGGEWL